MGNFGEKVVRGVKWLGRCVCKVVRWFAEVVETVGSIVKNFLYSIENILKDADDPQNLGECAGIKKEMIELEKQYDKRREKLSTKDKNKLDSLFDERDY
jgi:hypothetical protein